MYSSSKNESFLSGNGFGWLGDLGVGGEIGTPETFSWSFIQLVFYCLLVGLFFY